MTKTWTTKPRVAVVLIGMISIILAYAAPPANAAPILTVEPIAWDVVGLDSNGAADPDGPNKYPVGARVCNVGDAVANNVTADFVWDSVNVYVDLVQDSPSSLTVATLAAGDCVTTGIADFYFNIEVAHDAAAFDTTREYHIEVDSDETGPIQTPADRQIYIERLVSQNRNQINSITGPATVYVGETYTYVLDAKTATNGYEQLEVFIDFPNNIFQIVSVDVTYTAPTGATNDTLYADACGWDPDPASTDYLSCVGPENYLGGKAGGNTVTTYQVKILSSGVATVTGLIYDSSGSSFHYNSDFGSDVLAVEAFYRTDLAVTKSDSADPVTVGDQFSYTVTVTNNGPDDATGVTVVDTLPSEVSFVSAVPDQGSCSEALGVVTCPLGDITNGDSVDVVITVDADEDGTATNDVSVSGNEADLDSSNDDASEDTVIDPAADLEVTKVDAVDPVGIGDDIAYTITVTNNGPDDATGVTVVDTLPSEVSYQSATPDQGSCSEASSVVTCNLGAIANGDSVDITIVANADSSGTATNDVSVSGNEADQDSSNDDDSEDTVIDPSVDLEVVKVDAADPVTVGDDITYTVTVTNSGPDAATGVTVVDTLPADVSYQSATPDQGSCSETGGVVTCNLGAVANGASVDVVIVVTADEDGTVTNDVSVSGNEDDPGPSNDSDSEDTTVDPGADLAVTKSDSADPVTVGDQFSYTVTVTNNGPDAATGVTTVDTLPAEVSYVSAVPDQGSCSEALGVVTCPLGAIANGASVDIVITVDADSSGTVTNDVSVSGNEGDLDSGNDSDSEDTTINAAPLSVDLGVTKSDSADPVIVGDQFSYTVTVTNNGPDDVTGVTVTDTLPGEVGYVSAVPDQGSCTESGGVVTCSLGAIANGASVDVVITVDADSSGTATNDVSVAGGQPDPNSTNDSDSENTVINTPPPAADLGVSKSDSADPVTVGDQFSYTVTVTNNGPDAATGVTATDTLPGEVSYVSAVPDQGSCTESGGVVTCSLGAIANGAGVDIVITVDADVDGTALNSVSATGDQADSNSSNDADTENTTINPVPPPDPETDLEVTKSDTVDPVTVGDPVTYTVTVTNNGPDGATGVTVIDTLPGEVTYVSATPSQGSCSETGGVVTCSLGAIANGDTATIIIVATADTAGTATNGVSVSGIEDDPDSSNDSDSEDTTINAAPPPTPETDLTVAKVDAVDPVSIGDSVTYTVTVTNNGPDDATGVTVTDTLPSEVSYVSATPAQGSCSQAGGVVTCALGAIANGASVDIVIVTTATTDGSALNSVSVTGDQTDSNAGNDAATETTTINPPPPEVDLAVSKSDSVDPVMVGDPVTYTVTITNNGPDGATGVTVIDTLPSQVSYVSATPSQGSCSQAGGVVTCALGAIANGDVATITIATTATGAGTATNNVSVSGDQVDPNSGNDSDTEDTTINSVPPPPPDPEADLAVVKGDSADPVTVGNQFTYTITAINNGPDGATGVMVTDTLPPEVSYVSAVPGQGSCGETGGVVTCSLGAVANGASVDITITVDADSAGVANNVVSVSGDQDDPNSSNDSDSEDTTIDSPPPPPADPSSIGDTVFYDFDGDGNQDPGDPGLEGVTVRLLDDSAAEVAATTTDSNGSYLFDNLSAGDYSVEIDLPSGTALTTTANPSPVALTIGEAYVDADFGLIGTGAIGQVIWHDENENGFIDGSEQGSAGVPVAARWAGIDGILGTSDDLSFSAVTNSSGTYTIPGLPAGSYRVIVDGSKLPAGYQLTYTPDGNDDLVDDLNLGAGETVNDENFGYALAESLPATGADIDRVIGFAIALMALGSGFAFVGGTVRPRLEDG